MKKKFLSLDDCIDSDGQLLRVSYKDKVNAAVAIEFFGCRWVKDHDGRFACLVPEPDSL